MNNRNPHLEKMWREADYLPRTTTDRSSILSRRTLQRSMAHTRSARVLTLGQARESPSRKTQRLGTVQYATRSVYEAGAIRSRPW
jgi:hypothetical protein